MYIHKDDIVLYCDVDETLINHSDTGKLTIIDPYTGKKIRVNPNKEHIHILKKATIKGYSIIVWSFGGVLWAAAAIKALELEPYVSAVLPKPNLIMDDVPWEAWNPHNVHQNINWSKLKC